MTWRKSVVGDLRCNSLPVLYVRLDSNSELPMKCNVNVLEQKNVTIVIAIFEDCEIRYTQFGELILVN